MIAEGSDYHLLLCLWAVTGIFDTCLIRFNMAADGKTIYVK